MERKYLSMAVFLLIRHGSNDMLGKGIAGRMKGLHLNDAGRVQAEQLAERLARVPITGIYSSPLERTRETAAPLAAKLGLDVNISEAVLEVDFGEWTGRSLEELRKLEKWKHFNLFRCGMRIPGGEMMAEVQARVVGELEYLREQNGDAVIAIFSHGDPIKTAIAHYMGVPLDFLLRIEISPASVSIISVNDWGPRILCVNNTGEDLPPLG